MQTDQTEARFYFDQINSKPVHATPPADALTFEEVSTLLTARGYKVTRSKVRNDFYNNRVRATRYARSEVNEVHDVGRFYIPPEEAQRYIEHELMLVEHPELRQKAGRPPKHVHRQGTKCDSCGTTQGNIVGDYDRRTFQQFGFLCVPCKHLVDVIVDQKKGIEKAIKAIEYLRSKRV